MQKKAAFLSSAHLPFDDRIYYHQAKSLARHGYDVVIISSAQQVYHLDSNITIDSFIDDSADKSEKISKFNNLLIKYQPDIIICSEPLPILAANKFKRSFSPNVKIVYDITEWYPSNKNITGKTPLKKVLTFIKLFLFNWLTSSLADAFIFGEYYKKIPYHVLFPFKKWEIIGYCPKLDYFDYKVAKLGMNKLVLGYTGELSEEKGFFNFLAIVEFILKNKPAIQIELKIIGWFSNKNEKDKFDEFSNNHQKLKIELSDYMKFTDFVKSLNDIDLFFDLRNRSFEYNYSLPIKLFYYMACGRPVIYSDIKAIRKEINGFNVGYLVNPLQYEQIANLVIGYVNNNRFYYEHASNARKLSEVSYNWEKFEMKFIYFINSLTKN